MMEVAYVVDLVVGRCRIVALFDVCIVASR